MNHSLRVLLFALTIISLAACCPNGCFVLSGPAYKALAHPRPMREDWLKAGNNDTERRSDWEICGGYENGNFVPDIELLRKEKRADESNTQGARHRLFLELQRCMLRKGYQYIGKCYDNEISRALPACGAP